MFMKHAKNMSSTNNQKSKVIIIIVLLFIVSIAIYLYNNRNSKVRILKEYNSIGQLIGTNEYFIRDGDTIMEGKFVNYNNEGIKISEGQFVNDDVFGNCFYYYDDGKLESIHYRENSKITLESTFYDSSGLLNKYVVYDDTGEPFFIIEFDEKGATQYNGHFHLEIYQYKFSHKEKFNLIKDQYLKVGDTLKYSYLIANIPNAKRSFTIENLSVDNAKVKRFIKKVEPCQLDVQEVLTKKGKNTIRSIVKYDFNDNITPVFRDTLSFDIDVK